MQGHAAANVVPVIAANRYGLESVEPCDENGGQRSALQFYGSSFITDETGELIVQAERSGDSVITAKLNLEQADKARLEWGLFRDRRPECYGIISE